MIKKLPFLIMSMLLPATTFGQEAVIAETSTGNTTSALPCGGDLASWIQGIAIEAKAAGISEASVRKLVTAVIDQRVLKRDRTQTIFNMTFADFSARLISKSRLQKGRENLQKYKAVFDKAEKFYGVPAPVITAFWGLETDYGAIQGDFDTLNALFTLSYDCRRPGLFRPQLIALLKLFDRGVINASTTGAWAGEIGQMQLLPRDYLERGVDGDGDGKIDLKNSAPDAIMTAARMLSELGWQRNQPWLEEVRLTHMDMPWQEAKRSIRKSRTEWIKLGVAGLNGPLDIQGGDAALLLPMGRKGPAFLAPANFDIFVEWNQSIVYATTAAYFAARLDGAPAFTPGQPDPGLTTEEIKALQEKMLQRGHKIGKVDGIGGVLTRDAVRQEQLRLNMPADSWPTKELLEKL